MDRIRSRITVLLSALILLLPGIIHAQPVELTLKDALNYAIKNNIDVKKAKLAVERGRYKTEEVRSQALPQITGSGALSYSPIVGQLVIDTLIFQMGRPWNSSVGVQLSQQLFNQQVFTGLKASEASEDYYLLNQELSEEQIIERVSGIYYQVLLNRAQLAVIDSNIKSTTRIEKMIADQYKNGLARRIDLDRVKVNLTNLNTQLDQLKNAILQQELQLKYYMGMPIKTDIRIPEVEINTIELNASITDTVNYRGRTEFMILKKQEDLLNLQEKAYKAEYYPSLSLTSNYTYTGMSNKFDLYKSGGSSYWYDAASIGLSLHIPVFNGFATRSRVRQARVDILENRENQLNTIEALNMANENAKIQIRNSINTIHTQRENVKLAEEVYNSTQNNYKNGLSTLTDLLDAENSLTSAKNSYNQALLNYKIAEIQLLKSNGNIKSLLN